MQVIKSSLKTARRVELPARTEVIVECKTTSASSWLQQSVTVTKPCSNQWCYAENGMVIGSALKTPERPDIIIPVMNLTNKLRTLCRGMRIGEACSITKCDRIKGMLSTPPDYSDDSEDSEDEDWLRDRHVKYSPLTSLQGRATF